MFLFDIFDVQKQPPGYSVKKKDVLKNFAIFTGKDLRWSLFFKKEIPTQVFSSEYCKKFKNTCEENLRTAASG